MVGGAVRNALLGVPIARDRRRHHGGAGRGGAPRRRGRLQGGADRHRARHRHRRHRQASVRGDHAAPGRRDLWPPRQGRLRPRLAGRRRAARLHHQRAVGDARRHGLRLCRRARRSRRAARALHRRSGTSASRKTICASCASSASTPLTATAHPDRGRPRRLHRRPRRARPALARARAHGDDETAGRAARGADAHRHDRCRVAAARARRRAAIWRASRTWPRSRRRSAQAPDPVRRLGALARDGGGGCRAAVAEAAADQ